MFRHLVLVSAVVAGALAGDWEPRPSVPGETKTYPKDQCSSISEGQTFDYLVVGAGPAGCALASRLAAAGCSILLIEAGDAPPTATDMFSNTDVLFPGTRWNYGTEPSNICKGYKNESCQYVSGKALGGSSILNAGMYVRGNKADYNEWKKRGNPGWGYDEVLPFFKKLENYGAHPITCKQTNKTVSARYHSTGGPVNIHKFAFDEQSAPFAQAFLKAAEENGIPRNLDATGYTQIGFTEVPTWADEAGYRDNCAKAYLREPLPKNIMICMQALVVKVLFEDKRAVGVELIHTEPDGSQKTMTVRANKKIVLCAGAINTPLILQRSGIGPAAELAKAGIKCLYDSKGVGLMDDQWANLDLFYCDTITKVSLNLLSVGITKLTGFWNTKDPNSCVPNMQVFMRPFTPEWAPFLGWKDSITAQMNASTFYLGCTRLVQENKGCIYARDADVYSKPRINPNQMSTEEEENDMVTCTQKMREVMSSPQLAQFNIRHYVLNECKQYEYNSKEEILCNYYQLACTLYHNSCTAKMGPASDPFAVVDHRLHVRGVTNLMVADSAAFATIPRSNTMIPSTMMGEKGAAIIREEGQYQAAHQWTS